MVTMTDEQVEDAIREMGHEAASRGEGEYGPETAAEALEMALCVDVEGVREVYKNRDSKEEADKEEQPKDFGYKLLDGDKAAWKVVNAIDEMIKEEE